MTLFIKSFKPVFSPMLSSFGGGSIRGFRGGGGPKITSVTGESVYTTAGTYTWTAPSGVFAVDVVAVGAAGGTGNHGTGGGGLGYKNQIPVTPGAGYTVVVGQGGMNHGYQNSNLKGEDGEDSYFISASTVKGGKSLGTPTYQQSAPAYSTTTSAGGTYVGDGGGNGGLGGDAIGSSNGPGGGGAGGYSGNGGTGGNYSGWNGGGGGGVGLYGEGTSGYGGSGAGPGQAGSGGGGGGGGGNNSGGGGGGGGSGGNNGTAGSSGFGLGGNYGGGSGANNTGSSNLGRSGGGAVRIIWGPPGTRSFPNNAT